MGHLKMHKGRKYGKWFLNVEYQMDSGDLGETSGQTNKQDRKSHLSH